MAKTKISKQIREARDILADAMRDNLITIADTYITKIMKAYKNANDSQKPYAAKGIEASGFASYKEQVLELLAVAADFSLEEAKKEVPTKKKVAMSDWNEEAVKLGEFDKLPKSIKKRLNSQVDLLMQTQKSDLEKVVLYQFSSSVNSTDSASLLEHDLIEKVEDFIDGPSITGGASVVAGRVINETRNAYFFEDEVLEEIDAFQFVNDVPETPICEYLNGKLFLANDPNYGRYLPPLHYNCDSYIIPILSGNLGNRDIDGLDVPSDLEKYVQFGCGKNCTGNLHLVEIN